MIDAVQRKPAVQPLDSNGRVVEAIGRAVLRYGLVLFLVAFGLAKFTEFEAQWIQPLLANSPFFGWMYGVTSGDPVPPRGMRSWLAARLASPRLRSRARRRTG